MSAPEYGRSLRNLTINLLVRSIDAAVKFQTQVLGADIVFSDPDIAVLRAYDAEWMMHADHTYLENPIFDLVARTNRRGVGAEFRLHGCNPDTAAERAHHFGYMVFAEPANKPHGLRECYLQDTDGYMWVPDIPIDDDINTT